VSPKFPSPPSYVLIPVEGKLVDLTHRLLRDERRSLHYFDEVKEEHCCGRCLWNVGGSLRVGISSLKEMMHAGESLAHWRTWRRWKQSLESSEQANLSPEFTDSRVSHVFGIRRAPNDYSPLNERRPRNEKQGKTADKFDAALRQLRMECGSWRMQIDYR